MTVSKKYMGLVKKYPTKPEVVAVELFNYCNSCATLWKILYYASSAIIIVLTLSYNFANVFYGGQDKYTEFLHNISAITFIVSIIQAFVMLILPFRTWQKFEKLETQISGSYSEFVFSKDTVSLEDRRKKLGQALYKIVMCNSQMNEEIAAASSDYFKKYGHEK